MSILKLENLCYSYEKNKQVLKNINYSFEKSKLYAITGKSGSGKTTLLSIISSLDKPSSGKILYNDMDISDINESEYRSRNIGVVFQSFNLLPHLTALENVILSMDISGINIDRKGKKKEALNLLEDFGINEEKANRKILKLSGGEQQRVAIARALSYDPKIILADEPTGNLDSYNEEQIIQIFKNLAHNKNKCVIIVTHSNNVSNNADIVYNLENNNKLG